MTKLTGKIGRRVKRIRSHAGHARFLAEVEWGVGEIDRDPNVPSPYEYSAEWVVHRHPIHGIVCVRETSHRCFDVFKVEGV